MHDGCNGNFENGKQVVDKIRMMGFNKQAMPVPAVFECKNCGEQITMVTMEYKCPHCGMVYGVTPCHAFDINNIMAAGIDY
jgi:Zn finger protein HypA/HybF involved in hydrogenase expression